MRTRNSGSRLDGVGLVETWIERGKGLGDYGEKAAKRVQVKVLICSKREKKRRSKRGRIITRLRVGLSH